MSQRYQQHDRILFRPSSTNVSPTTLEELATQMTASDDPAATTRLISLSTELRAGQSNRAVNGVVILASVLPAWWFEEPELFEIRVMIVGARGSTYELVLVDEAGREHRLTPSPSRNRVKAIESNLELSTLVTFVNKAFESVDEDRLRVRGGVGLSGDELAKLLRPFREHPPAWRLRCGDEEVPVAIAPLPSY
jgi:hypothetical protein